jgi:hypothetical protein
MGVLRRTCGSDGSRRAGGVSEVPAADYSLGGTTATRRAPIRPGGPAAVLREDGEVRGGIRGVSGARPPSPVLRRRAPSWSAPPERAWRCRKNCRRVVTVRLPKCRRDRRTKASGLYQWGDRALPLRYYSRERLFSALARRQWVRPDAGPPACVKGDILRKTRGSGKVVYHLGQCRRRSHQEGHQSPQDNSPCAHDLILRCHRGGRAGLGLIQSARSKAYRGAELQTRQGDLSSRPILGSRSDFAKRDKKRNTTGRSWSLRPLQRSRISTPPGST